MIVRVALLCGLALMALSPLRSAGLVYEDRDPLAYMETSREVMTRPWHGWTAERGVLMPAPRSLTNASYRVQAWAGATASGYHAGNVAIHLLNGLLLAWLVGSTGLAAVLLFVLHPINMEAVAYLSARTDLLCATGILLMLIASERDDWTAPAGATVGAAVAVLAKESGIVAILLLPIWLIYRRRWHREWAVTMSMWALSALPLVYRLVHVSATAGAARPWGAIAAYTSNAAYGVVGYAAMQSAALLRLLALIVWPNGFSIDHDFDRLPFVVALIAGAFVVAGLLWALRDWRDREHLTAPAFMVLWVIGSLAIRFAVPMPEYLHEQHLYVPLIGVWIGLAVGIRTLMDRLENTRFFHRFA